jgi:hypothetical protein
MKVEEYRKNILDLRYQEQLQKLNAILVFISVGILGFVGSFVWQYESLAAGLLISIIVMVLGFILYRRTKDRMEGILSEIEAIKPMPKLKRQTLQA